MKRHCLTNSRGRHIRCASVGSSDLHSSIDYDQNGRLIIFDYARCLFTVIVSYLSFFLDLFLILHRKDIEKQQFVGFLNKKTTFFIPASVPSKQGMAQNKFLGHHTVPNQFQIPARPRSESSLRL